jgi:replicative DNA helicase
MNATNKLLDAHVPPQNLDAEKGVIGSMLLDPEVCDDVITIVRRPDEFYGYANQTIFRHVLDLHTTGQPIDVTLLAERLTARGDLESIGGLDYLAEVVGSVPTAANALHYAGIVHDKATRRSIIHTTSELLRDAYAGEAATAEVLGLAQTRLADLNDAQAGSDARPLSEWLDLTMIEVEKRISGEVETGIPTGLADLDAMLVGLKQSRLIVVAGRPGSGKSVLGLQLAAHAAIDLGKPVLFVSLEMSGQELTERLLAARSEVDAGRITTGRLDSDARRRLIESQNDLANAQLFIDDHTRRSVVEIAAQARRIQRRYGLDLIVIDYLQLIEPDSPRDPRHEQVARMARRLKMLSRELQIPVVCLAQLNREVEKHGSGKPKLSHLRESGSIEQDADVVILVHREEQNRPDDPDVIGQAELIVAKQRNGRTGTVKVSWQGETYRFLPLPVIDLEWNPDNWSNQSTANTF